VTVGTQAVTYIEIDLPTCLNTYGVAPCTASIPTTGSKKCFNTFKTCQDLVNFTLGSVTLRFCKSAAYYDQSIEAVPSLKSDSYTPGVISFGTNLGQRATLSLAFRDHPHPDTLPGLVDPYLSSRSYDPVTQGSFWGKFRARHPYILGRPLRRIRGFVGQALADMEVEHFVIDSYDGPKPDGTFTITAKDVLKLADDDKAQAPAVSNGTTLASMTNVATTFTLNPAGIGNLEYPASGWVNVGGKEAMSFTRVADAMTVVRAQLGSTAIAHAAGERVQLVLAYVGQDPAYILNDLYTNYTEIDPSWIPLSDWQDEVDSKLGLTYTRYITEPTGVNKLASQLIQEAAMAQWWDPSAQLIKLQVLSPIAPGATVYSGDVRMRSSLTNKEQLSTRLSEVWTFFGPRDYTQRSDNKDNYAYGVARIDATAATQWGSTQVKTIFSQWISSAGLPAAERCNNLQLGRYRDPPRTFEFSLYKSDQIVVPVLGVGCYISAPNLQDDEGARESVPCQVQRINNLEDRYMVTAEELRFSFYDSSDVTARVVTIGADTLDFNLLAAHDATYPELTLADVGVVTLECIILSSAVVGSSSASTPAFDVGTGWPTGFKPKITVQGRIQGKGGAGADFKPTAPPNSGNPGGTALKTTINIDLDDSVGAIWGGGGGGAQGGSHDGGGGGAGTQVGAGGLGNVPGADGNPGTATAGGVGGHINGNPSLGTSAGSGGGPGLTGAASAVPGTTTSAAGYCIDGIAHVTTIGTPADRRGPTV